MSKQFALQQGIAERRAVDRDDGSRFAAAGRKVDGAGDQFLAGSAFSHDQHRAGHGGHPLNLVEQLQKGRTLPDQLKATLQQTAELLVLLVEFAAAFDRRAQAAQLPQQRGDPLAQLLSADDQVRGTGSDHIGGQRDVPRFGHDHHRSFGRHPTDTPYQFQAVERAVAGFKVQEHQVQATAITHADAEFVESLNQPDFFGCRELRGDRIAEVVEGAVGRLENQHTAVHGI